MIEPAPRDPAERALELLRRHGRTTVSAQVLEPGFRYWFDDTDPGDAAMVAYVDTGDAWVAAGDPIVATERLAEVADRFARAAASASRRASFFAAEQLLVDAGLRALPIGEQPVWQSARWDDVLAGAPSLRYQLRRAQHKAVTIRTVLAAELSAGTRLRAALDPVIDAWQRRQRMLPMRFLVELEPFGRPSERLVCVAEREGVAIALASAVPVHARGRMFLEHLIRSPDAPNGTAELLVDAIIRGAHARGTTEVTLGLAPLAGGVPAWLRIARWLGRPLYDFGGLRAFKAKLRPHTWEPIYLCVSPGSSTLIALRDCLRAFAGGSLLGFGMRSLWRRPRAALGDGT